MIDLTEAVEAAAEAWYEENRPKSGMPWAEAPKDLQYVMREVVLPAVTAAAPLIATAALSEVSTDFIDWDVMYGHENASIESNISHETADHLRQRAEKYREEGLT